MAAHGHMGPVAAGRVWCEGRKNVVTHRSSVPSIGSSVVASANGERHYYPEQEMSKFMSKCN